MRGRHSCSCSCSCSCCWRIASCPCNPLCLAQLNRPHHMGENIQLVQYKVSSINISTNSLVLPTTQLSLRTAKHQFRYFSQVDSLFPVSAPNKANLSPTFALTLHFQINRKPKLPQFQPLDPPSMLARLLQVHKHHLNRKHLKTPYHGIAISYFLTLSPADLLTYMS